MQKHKAEVRAPPTLTLNANTNSPAYTNLRIMFGRSLHMHAIIYSPTYTTGRMHPHTSPQHTDKLTHTSIARSTCIYPFPPPPSLWHSSRDDQLQESLQLHRLVQGRHLDIKTHTTNDMQMVCMVMHASPYTHGHAVAHARKQ